MNNKNLRKVAGLGLAAIAGASLYFGTGKDDDDIHQPNRSLESIVSNPEVLPLTQEDRPRVNFYIYDSPLAQLPPEAVVLARDYLSKELGIDSEFSYLSKEEIDIMKVENNSDIKLLVYDWAESNVYLLDKLERVISESMEENSNLTIQEVSDYTQSILDHMNDPDIRGYALRSRNTGNSLGEIVLINPELNDYHTSAYHLLHEAGHIWGLGHTFQDPNDPHEDYLPSGLPNIMSYEEIPNVQDSFPFGFDEIQKAAIRDYLGPNN